MFYIHRISTQAYAINAMRNAVSSFAKENEGHIIKSDRKYPPKFMMDNRDTHEFLFDIDIEFYIDGLRKFQIV